MRTLLLGALVANLAGCSHQLPPAQMAANSCASTNQLACFMAVGVSLRPTSRASAKLESKPAVPRKTNAAAVSVSTAEQGSAATVDAKARHRRLAAVGRMTLHQSARAFWRAGSAMASPDLALPPITLANPAHQL